MLRFAVSLISNLTVGSLCFRHVRRIPFSDYLEITTAVGVQCGRAEKCLPVD